MSCNIRMIRFYLFFLAGLVFLSSCDDVFEQDINNENVILLGPMNGLTTELITHTFWWESVKGADSYNIQIVSPNFNGIERFVIDTLVEDSKFRISLEPGNFQWRVNAVNSYYKSSFTTYDLFIIQSSDNSALEQVLTFQYEDMPLSCRR